MRDNTLFCFELMFLLGGGTRAPILRSEHCRDPGSIFDDWSRKLHVYSSLSSLTMSSLEFWCWENMLAVVDVWIFLVMSLIQVVIAGREGKEIVGILLFALPSFNRKKNERERLKLTNTTLAFVIQLNVIGFNYIKMNKNSNRHRISSRRW